MTVDTLEHNSSDNRLDSRQQLIDTIHQLPDNLIQELVQFTNYLLYQKSISSPPSFTSEPLPPGKSEGYQKLKDSGLIGCGEAEADLSETYKARYAQEIVGKYDHR